MARPKNSFPSYRLHRPSGQAVAFIGRKAIYLGKHNSPESRERYRELIAQREIESRDVRPASRVTVAEMVISFAVKELPRFSKSEQHCQRTVLRLLVQKFGELPADQFSPRKLNVLRAAMVLGDPEAQDAEGKSCPRSPWSRRTANRQVKRIRAAFRWAVSEELVPIQVVQALDTLRILKPGELGAVESIPRSAVPQSDIDAARALLKPIHQDIYDLIQLTAARPGEIVGLTGAMIDRRGETWVVELKDHKNRHKGKARYLIFNSAAQVILLRRFKDDPAERIFKVRRDNFGTAVKRACIKAGVTPFCPHQLRHSAITKVVDQVGFAEAQALAGHSSPEMTRHYSRAAIEPAKRGARALETP